MASLVYSFVKKITSVVTLCLTAFFMLVLLTACPSTNNTDKKTTAINNLINIDSAALLGRLAIISSAEMAGRETGTPGNQRAREYITTLFDSLQLVKTNNSWLQPFPLSTVNQQQGTNIIGMIKGNRYPDNYIVITAHYDHLGIRNGAIYYGADDNASGTACLLTMAQYFKKHAPEHSLLFIAFDAEEKGLLGSKYFVAHSPVPLNTIAANINMDMVSRNDNNEIYACGIRYYPFLKKYVDSVAPHTPVHVLFGHDGDKPGAEDWTNQSDHYPFHINGVPFIYFGVEDHADYHRPSDTFDKVNKSFYYQTCTMITAVTTLIDQAAAIQ